MPTPTHKTAAQQTAAQQTQPQRRPQRRPQRPKSWAHCQDPERQTARKLALIRAGTWRFECPLHNWPWRRTLTLGDLAALRGDPDGLQAHQRTHHSRLAPGFTARDLAGAHRLVRALRPVRSRDWRGCDIRPLTRRERRRALERELRARLAELEQPSCSDPRR